MRRNPLKKTGLFPGGKKPLFLLGRYLADDEHNFTKSDSNICMDVKKSKRITILATGNGLNTLISLDLGSDFQ